MAQAASPAIGGSQVAVRGSVRSRPRSHLAYIAAVQIVAVGSLGCDGDGPAPAPPEYTLRVQGGGTGSGTVIAPGASPAISCAITAGAASGACVNDFPRNASVALVAAPNAESTFSGWSGACAGTGPCVVSMSQDQTVSASFAPPPVLTFRLTVTMAGQGSGTVSSSVGGIGCTLVSGSASGQCSATFVQGTQVTLTAAAPAGSSFAGWGGACDVSGTSTTCTIPMLQEHAVTATFVPTSPGITLRVDAASVQ